jgi:hypothetical protein
MFGCRRLSAILLLVAATVASLTTVEVGLSAEGCRIAPGAAAPSGSHWLYRIHRIDHRRCWFLSSNAAIAPRHRIAGATNKAPQVQLTNDTDENLPTLQKREEPALIAEASSTASVAKEQSSETLVARAVPVIVYKTQSTSSEPASEVRRKTIATEDTTKLSVIFLVGAVAAGLFLAGGIFHLIRDLQRGSDTDPIPIKVPVVELPAAATAPTLARDSGADLVQGLHELIRDKWPITTDRSAAELRTHAQPQLIEV